MVIKLEIYSDNTFDCCQFLFITMFAFVAQARNAQRRRTEMRGKNEYSK